MKIEETIGELVKCGEWVDFSHLATPPVVTASFIRELLLAVSALDCGFRLETRWLGLRLRGIALDGDINLASLGDEATYLSPLCLEQCFIKGSISLSGSRINSLSLRGSKVEKLDLSYCHISNSLDLRQIGPTSTYCTVDLWSSRIGGSLQLDGAELVAPNNQRALDASLAVIEGSAHLRRSFAARGHVRFHNAEIGKTLDLSLIHI